MTTIFNAIYVHGGIRGTACVKPGRLIAMGALHLYGYVHSIAAGVAVRFTRERRKLSA